MKILRVIDETRDWVEKFVLKLNLCPFAHQPYRDGRVRFVYIENFTWWSIQHIHEEIERLENDEAQTTIIIYPKEGALQDFETYLEFVNNIENVLHNLQLDFAYRIATFHPRYEFDKTEYDDPANRTNRSPYPMVHLIRVSDIDEAIKKHPDTKQIPLRNIELMRTIDWG
jgi:hypothetical protein